jgi:hypothetical protein
MIIKARHPHTHTRSFANVHFFLTSLIVAACNPTITVITAISHSSRKKIIFKNENEK